MTRRGLADLIAPDRLQIMGWPLAEERPERPPDMRCENARNRGELNGFTDARSAKQTGGACALDEATPTYDAKSPDTIRRPSLSHTPTNAYRHVVRRLCAFTSERELA